MSDQRDPDFDLGSNGAAGADGATDDVLEIVRALKTTPAPEPGPRLEVIAATARMTAASGVWADTGAKAQPRRRNSMFKTLMSSVLAKVLLVSSVALASVGGVAAAGNLPGPVQDGLAGSLRPIGIDLPSSDDEAEDEAEEETEEETQATEVTVAVATTTPVTVIADDECDHEDESDDDQGTVSEDESDDDSGDETEIEDESDDQCDQDEDEADVSDDEADDDDDEDQVSTSDDSDDESDDDSDDVSDDD